MSLLASLFDKLAPRSDAPSAPQGAVLAPPVSSAPAVPAEPLPVPIAIPVSAVPVPLTDERALPARRAPRVRKERRTAKKLVSYTPEEFAQVLERAAACGLPLARYIRETSLGAVPRARRGRAENQAIRELTRIGNTLNQLGHVANATGRLDEARYVREVLAGVLDAARRLDS